LNLGRVGARLVQQKEAQRVVGVAEAGDADGVALERLDAGDGCGIAAPPPRA